MGTITKETRMANSKLTVQRCFDLLKANERVSDSTYTMLNLITNCTLNLEVNDRATLERIMSAVNDGMTAAIAERKKRQNRFMVRDEHRFIL